MTASVEYQGSLHTLATHLRSGNTLVTDAPIDNKGKGEAFSPTDLLAVSLLTCKLTTMAIVAQNRGWPDIKSAGSVNKIMADGPRRVAKLEVSIELFGSDVMAEEQQRVMEAAARTCPVAKSLHPDVEVAVQFAWSPARP